MCLYVEFGVVSNVDDFDIKYLHITQAPVSTVYYTGGIVSQVPPVHQDWPEQQEPYEATGAVEASGTTGIGQPAGATGASGPTGATGVFHANH